MRILEPGQPGGGLDFIADADSPDDQLRVWVDGEAAPRLVIDPAAGITAGDGTAPGGPPAVVYGRPPFLMHVGGAFAASYVATGVEFPAHPIIVGGFSDQVIFRNVLDDDDAMTTASCIWIGRGRRDDPRTGGLHFDDTDGAAQAFAAALTTALIGTGDTGFIKVKIGASNKVWTRFSTSTARVVALAITRLCDGLPGWDSDDDNAGNPVPWIVDTDTVYLAAVPR